jgi:hypothetical protein
MAVRSPARAKRTYNLSERAIHRVRELAQREELPATQDGVVEVAIDRLYESVTYDDEASQWDAASDDPAFGREMAEIANVYDAGESWPT